jgi:hypothetical protein
MDPGAEQRGSVGVPQTLHIGRWQATNPHRLGELPGERVGPIRSA